MKNIILVRPRSQTLLRTPPLGLGYIFKAISDIQDINPVFIDMHLDNLKDEDFLRKIKELNPLIIGFQIFSVQYEWFRKILPSIRELCRDAIIVAGGPHVSGLPDQTLLANSCLDYVIQGEGENAIKLLADYLMKGSIIQNIEKIPNLYYRKENMIVRNKREFIDVNEYGAPAWEILKPDRYFGMQFGHNCKSMKIAPILTSRGCPHSCTFCAGPIITGNKIRLRNIKNVVDEIEFLISRYNIHEIAIIDENFAMYKDHVINLSKEIKKRDIKCFFSFPTGLNLDNMNEEIIYYLRSMGTYMVSIGIESASSKTLKSMGKKENLDSIKNKINLFKKNGIRVNGFFMLGFPGETMEDINKTINYALESNIDSAVFANYLPLPGTKNFNDLINRGEIILKKIDWGSYSFCSSRLPYHPQAITEKTLLMKIKYAVIRFYLKPRIMLNIVSKIFRPFFIKNTIISAFNLLKK